MKLSIIAVTILLTSSSIALLAAEDYGVYGEKTQSVSPQADMPPYKAPSVTEHKEYPDKKATVETGAPAEPKKTEHKAGGSHKAGSADHKAGYHRAAPHGYHYGYHRGRGYGYYRYWRFHPRPW